MLSLQKKMTINLISARLSKYIYLIQSWTILFVKTAGNFAFVRENRNQLESIENPNGSSSATLVIYAIK